MSLLDIYNSVQLEDVRADSSRDRHIVELSQQAEMITRMGGKPKSWFEFKREHQKELREGSSTGVFTGIGVGGALGVVVGAALAMTSPAGAGLAAMALSASYIGLIGAVIGGMLGYSHEMNEENASHKKVVDGYQNYLNSVEQSLSRAPSVGAAINYRDDHAQRLEATREQQHEQMLHQR